MQSFKVVEAVGKHTGTVIFLHGLGDQGTSFIPLAQMLQRTHPHLKFILPTALSLPITVNGGYKMPAWFDINALDKLTESIHDDEQGMLRSVSSIEGLLEDEVTKKGIKSERIVVGGFSQGCVIATLTGLRTKRVLAGIVGLSGWLPLSHKIETMIDPGAKNLAFFWGHGKDDQVVNYKFGQASTQLLQSIPSLTLPLLPKGKTFARPGLRFETYPGLGHSLGNQELNDFSDWLGEAIPA